MMYYAYTQVLFKDLKIAFAEFKPCTNEYKNQHISRRSRLNYLKIHKMLHFNIQQANYKFEEKTALLSAQTLPNRNIKIGISRKLSAEIFKNSQNDAINFLLDNL